MKTDKQIQDYYMKKKKTCFLFEVYYFKASEWNPPQISTL